MPSLTALSNFDAMQQICERQIELEYQIRVNQGTAQIPDVELDDHRNNVSFYYLRLKQLHQFTVDYCQPNPGMWDYLGSAKAYFAITKRMSGGESYNLATSKFMALTVALDYLRAQIIQDKESPFRTIRTSILLTGVYLSESLIEERQEYLNLKKWHKTTAEKILHLDKKIDALRDLIHYNACIIQNPGFVELPQKLMTANETMLATINPNDSFYKRRKLYGIVSATMAILTLSIVVAFAPAMAVGTVAGLSLVSIGSVLLALSFCTFTATLLSAPNTQKKFASKLHDTIRNHFFQTPPSASTSTAELSTNERGMTFSRDSGFSRV